MRFDKLVHWADGLLLQPHHLQEMQRSLMNLKRSERYLYLPYNQGIIDFEIDIDALGTRRVVIKRLSAIMPDGQEISMPGNALISPLTLTIPEGMQDDKIIVYLAVPHWSEHEANLNEDGGNRRLYSIKEVNVKDENSGENEIVILKRMVNARLVSELPKASDCSILPVLKLVCTYKNATEPRFILSDYMPPFLFVTKDCPLIEHISELVFQLHRRKDKILSDLTVNGYNPEEPSPSNIYAIFQLRSINSYEFRLNALIATEKITPFALYLELRSLLLELAALQPFSKRDEVPDYNHLDAMPAFKEILSNIRSLMLMEGYTGYNRYQFKNEEGSSFYQAAIKEEELIGDKEYYLAIVSLQKPSDIAPRIELGDTFKLINPKARNERIRGIKLKETRYPPRFLPVISNAVWFKLLKDDSLRIWNDIRNERSIAIDVASSEFKGMNALLFVIYTQDSKNE